jgi:hypothetical protein
MIKITNDGNVWSILGSKEMAIDYHEDSRCEKIVHMVEGDERGTQVLSTQQMRDHNGLFGICMGGLSIKTATAFLESKNRKVLKK